MVTIKDVAKYAGVNASTVSRVLADHASISQQTKDRVRAAMDELNYVPNVAAKMLASNATFSIGVVLPPMKTKERVAQPFSMEMLNIINSGAKEKGLTVSIASGETIQDLEIQVKLMYQQRRVDGFILMYSEIEDSVSRFLVEHDVPFVVVGEPHEQLPNITTINNDNQAMAETVCEHLYRLKHENVLFITDDIDSAVCTQRYSGYVRSMEKYGLEAHELILFDVKKPKTLQHMIDTLQEKNITALIVVDDILSLKVMQFLSYYKISVPDEVSVVSFNNTPFATILHPTLTSVDINIEQLAQQSLKYLLKNMKNNNRIQKQIIVPYTLVERESAIQK